jgi:hypothetical protein
MANSRQRIPRWLAAVQWEYGGLRDLSPRENLVEENCPQSANLERF